ncbi:uncharacterized protein LOC131680357 [Topomyia yanbarensis]|uniref:uncharacterized protein LOC131680357 n=1 Tax=Topomyia yanbarensis TaxID=2498891 RepID=UPI00273CAE84|nr:uncharacterized protein LOC131680357 [Topomyia yanbarensis]
MASKAVHIEMVYGLSSASFISVLKRFVSRRGRVSDLYCDNARMFVQQLQKHKQRFDEIHSSNSITKGCTGSGIQFHFNPARSPHCGGLWEAAVKIFKHHLYQIMRETHLSIDDFHTLITQIEGIMNSRPLTALSSDPADVIALTPGNFLKMQQKLQHFWKCVVMPPKEEKVLGDRLVQRNGLLAIRDALEKFIIRYDPARDAFQLSVRIESLDRVYAQFMEAQDAIERLDKEEFLASHLAERVDFEQRYCAAKGFLLSKVPVEANNSALNTSMMANQHTFSTGFHLRLPKIDLPRFDGDFSRWLSFRDTFTSMVHSNGNIPTVAKLQYLLQSLEGDAKKPFESVDVEADNYASTWDALHKRYDNRRFLKRQLFRTLYELPAVKQESAKRIHSLVDDFQRHVRALAKLDEPVEHWDTPLANMLSYKLDQSTLRAWEEKTSSQDDVKYEELVEFLYQRVRVLNSVGPDTQQPAPPKVAGPPSWKGTKVKFAANAAATPNQDSPCQLACSDSHSLRNCPVFLGKDVRQRRKLVSQKRLCWNCLSFGHPARKCVSKFTCRTCHERHHSLLHDSSPSRVSSSPAITGSSQQSPPVQQPYSSSSGSAPPQVSMAVQTACSMVLLETVVLNIVDDHGREHKARALLDSASMSNFISGQLAKVLLSRRTKVDISVAGIGLSTQRVKNAITASIESRTQPFSTKLEFFILKQPSAELPTMPVDTSAWKFPQVGLADPQFHVPGRIDLVIGSEAFWELHTGRKISLGNGLPWVVETPFGWVVSGSASNGSTCIPRICNLSITNEDLEATLQKFWELEAISTGPAHSPEENRCEELYSSTVKRDSTGRYVVRLPHNEDPEVFLGASRAIAERRFHSLERRLQRDPAIKESYNRFMDEYLQLGHMRRLDEPVDDVKAHCYLPHHPVFKESSTTTKVRVVFDASCKTASGYSLNDTLLVGPVVQQDLLSIVMRFRTHHVALVADIEKMYRQVFLHLEDQPFQRILWRTGPDEPIATYELQTVTYGTASAPYLATRTLQQIAQDTRQSYPIASGPVTEDFYVDDFLSGAPDVESAIKLRREASAMLASAGLPLRKWASNSPEVLGDVPPDDVAIQPFHNLQDDQAVSTLGLIWEPRLDILRFKVQLPLAASVLTKRKVMSYIAQIFDPLGLVGPTITKAKLFMQRLWALKQNGEAYSTTVLQWLRGNPSRWKTFVANRVSQIQLSTDLNRWKHVPGVDNPADDISRGLSPTDILNSTRWWTGTPWLSRSPDFWPNPTLPAAETPEVSAEGRKIPLVAMTTTQLSFCTDLFARYSNFSKLRRVAAFIQRYLHVLRERASQRRSEKEKYKPLVIPSINPHPVRPLTAQELQHAELSLCHLAQGELFAEEISDLASGERVARSSTLKWLNPFVDPEGTVRVGGRLRNAALTDAKKHPIVLSAKHPLAVLLASFYHLKLLHAGPQLLLATLRQKFWILGGRNLVKSVFHRCHTCFHSKPTLVQQSTADLPASRVSPTRPFSVCGVDYCGPFYLKSAVRNRGPTKVYVAIFVCFFTKAVHIELVSDLSTPAFLAALRRLVARRGKVVELHSDNATAFKGAPNALNRIYRMLKVDESDRNQIFDWCSDNEIRWKFIPPRAPHFGGLWEAAVKSAKTHLLKAIGNVNVAYEDMLTLLAQIEMCLNSRPLTPMPDDPSDLEVLTSGHFLVGSNLQAVPEADLKETPDNHLDHWELTQKRFQTIWSRWYTEYLQQLQSRATKGCNPPVSVDVGRVAIVKEDNIPPTNWPLGQIIKCHPGADGIVRVVTLRTAAAKEVVRPVARIALLPTPPTQRAE